DVTTAAMGARPAGRRPVEAPHAGDRQRVALDRAARRRAVLARRRPLRAPVLRRRRAERGVERPAVALEVLGAVGAIAVGLIGGRGEDLRPRRAGALVVGGGVLGRDGGHLPHAATV